jgi:uncharacterized membrane protein
VRSPKALDRLIAFADAVVAIAMTLLVLPLVDLPNEGDDRTVADMFRDNTWVFGAFLVSFLVIAQLWLVHHRLFEHVERVDTPIVHLTLLWLLTVIFLPFPTEWLGTEQDRGTYALYIGTLLLSSLSLSAARAWLVAHPRMMADDAPADPDRGLALWTTSMLIAAALVLAVALPGVGMWWLFLLFLSGPLEAVLRRRSTRSTKPPAAVA